jgi:hypothetical protein
MFWALLGLAGCQSGTQVGVFKGTFDVYFTGQVIDGASGKAIEEFTTEIMVADKVAINKTVVPNGSEYVFSFEVTTINGRTYFKDTGFFNYKEISVLGAANEYVVIKVGSRGYKSREYRIAKENIRIDQVNVLDIVLSAEE